MSKIWNFYKKKCPECGSRNIKKLNKYRRRWVHRVIWKLIEERLFECNHCNNRWWE